MKGKECEKILFRRSVQCTVLGFQNEGGLEGKIDLRGFWEQGRPGMVSLELYP